MTTNTILGWNDEDARAFTQLLKKANTEQLNAIIREVKAEHNRRMNNALTSYCCDSNITEDGRCNDCGENQ